MAETQKSQATSLHRGLSVLEFLATAQPSATIAELSERLGYPTASLYRIASVLTEMDYLGRDPTTKRYHLTNKMLRFGQPQSQQRGLVEAAAPALRGLWKSTGETSQICCLADTDTVVLEQLISVHPFKYSTNIGARTPSYSCAPGKAMIAWLPDELQESLITRLKYKRFTSTTITSRKHFREDIKAIRRRGYAIDDGEGLEGIRCVAAPILDGNACTAGAITIAAPASRL
ncbi:MAG: IclR family transcriptional regulator, partial [Lacipirellulaceae bacterium]